MLGRKKVIKVRTLVNVAPVRTPERVESAAQLRTAELAWQNTASLPATAERPDWMSYYQS